MSVTQIQKQGGGSKKGRAHSANLKSGKYTRQVKRTRDNTIKSLKKHLEKHPNDLQNKKDIEMKMKTI
jgi:ribosomal protein S15P/S13E